MNDLPMDQPAEAGTFDGNAPDGLEHRVAEAKRAIESIVLVAHDPVPAELRTMLRQVLETRFKLKAHVETKKVDVVALRLTGA